MLFSKKYSLKVLVIFSVFVICVTCITYASAAEAPSITINLAQYNPTGEFPAYRAAEYFKKRVDELSKGRIAIKHFPGDLLGDWQTQDVSIKEGSLDMALVVPSSLFDPELEFIQLPYLVFSWEGFKKIFGHNGTAEAILNEIFERNNCHLLGTLPAGFIGIISKKEFTPLPGDPSVARVKTRVMPLKLDEITGKTLGFQTLTLPFGEIHSGLMLGLIDAAMGPTTAESTIFKDVIKYIYNYHYNVSAVQFVVNHRVWNKLTKEDQEILQLAMDEAIEIEWGKALETEQLALKELEEAGVKIVNLTPEQMNANVKACRDIVYKWAADSLYSKEFMDKVLAIGEPVVEY